MNDVELLFCTYPGHPDLETLIELSADKHRPHALRETSLQRLVELCHVELATAKQRWTPHYDQVLRFILAKDVALLDVDRQYGEHGDGPYETDHWWYVRELVKTHASFVGVFQSAMARGARMLSDAFDLISIATSEARAWLLLVPDQDALVEQIHAAAERCIARMKPTTYEIRTDYVFVKHVLEAASIDEMLDLGQAPLELFVELGNPFLPKTRPGAEAQRRE